MTMKFPKLIVEAEIHMKIKNSPTSEEVLKLFDHPKFREAFEMLSQSISEAKLLKMHDCRMNIQFHALEGDCSSCH